MEKYSGKWVLQTIVDGNPFYLHGAYAHHISKTYTPNTNKVKHALKFESKEAAEKFKQEKGIMIFNSHIL
ncbi:hypothetical protein H9Q13_06190 [Pontibacter sp. JH31]|uniref:Uncharacterized protein n=1 Tax=Pontibacter aquaedesilientis TaxID=2766980 RepID=A0ABR7XEN0_9BACT|nr:hypothetical protein [Pontibacter aquaedesilientis]MBD1396750.1 hypothetical protein [Pontibacter aquaedesilientis]